MEVHKVVLTTDFSELSRTAYVSAVALTQKFGAELTLVHTVESLPPFYYMHAEGLPTDLPLDPYLDELRATLQGEVDTQPELRDAGANVELIYHGFPQKALAQFVRERDVDIVVVCTHGRTGLGHFLMGSFAEKLVRVCPAPVLVHRGSGPDQFAKILVPYDFSENSQAVLPLIRWLAENYGSKFTLAHVLEPLPYTIAQVPTPGPLAGIRELAFDAPVVAEERFMAIRDEELAGVDVEWETCEGSAPTEIVHLAERGGFDLVLLATHGWTGMQHLLLGSVAEKVVRKAPCSVMTVRPPH